MTMKMMSVVMVMPVMIGLVVVRVRGWQWLTVLMWW